jgi:predicted SAM-dependent methyltransferase
MIPKLIHHVWPGQDPFRAELQPFRASFLRHHPDWTLHFWRTELGQGVSPEVQAVLDDSRYTVVVKSDIARFEILRLHGGIYVDTDVECLRPFDALLGDAFFCGRENDSMLCPSVVGCVSGHPLCELMVRSALGRLREVGPARANATPNEISGPFLLTQLAQHREDVRLYDRSFFYPIGWWETERLHEVTQGAYAKHWWNGTTAEGWTKKQRFGEAPLPHERGSEPVKYDLGGTTPRAGYVTVNLARGADRACDILDLDTVHPADGDVDEFLIEHTLEHVPVTRYVAFLKHLHRKLRPGGAVVVVQTDAEAVIRDYAAGKLSFRSMRSTLFTPEDRVQDNVLQTHHNMWSAEELARDFRAVGFEARTFAAGSWAFDMHDPLYDEDLKRDHGKPIRNLGVRATKR